MQITTSSTWVSTRGAHVSARHSGVSHYTISLRYDMTTSSAKVEACALWIGLVM
jgi:hypothetical protein